LSVAFMLILSDRVHQPVHRNPASPAPDGHPARRTGGQPRVTTSGSTQNGHG
jgi:hypothetical protein